MNKWQRAQAVARYIVDVQVKNVYPGITWDSLSSEYKRDLQTVVMYALDYAESLPEESPFNDIPNPLENEYQWP